MIWYHGISCADVRVVVERFPNVILPSRKGEKISVPGRSGDILIQQDAWENVRQPYDIYISAERPRLCSVAHQVAEWLLVPGYNRLEDSYWLDYFRLATYAGGAEIENVLGRFGRATIEFDCMPQRWLKSGEHPVAVSGPIDLMNPTPYTAAPLITVSGGTGAGAVTIGDYTIELDRCDGILLDCETEDATRNGQNFNLSVSGSFPKLPAGKIPVSFSGAVQGLQIVPRWYTL